MNYRAGACQAGIAFVNIPPPHIPRPLRSRRIISTRASLAGRWRRVLACVAAISLLASAGARLANAQNVLTERYDNARTGANLSETQLTPATVSTSTFGKVWDYSVVGSVYAQPLYVQNVAIPGQGTHNVVYVVTMDDEVDALDASSPSHLWGVNIALQVSGATPVPISDIVSPGQNITGNVGIESTPVIDLSTNTMYLVARTKEPTATCGGLHGNYCQRLHALDITTGAEKLGGPVVISATSGAVTFDTLNENQRASLALANGQIYVSWASHQDRNVWYGWIMSYNASTLQQTGVFVPSQPSNGVWMSGRAPAIDPAGNIYYITGNGSWDAASNFSESMLKFSPGSGLSLVDWFTPDNHAFLDSNDLDYGASGPLLVPGTSLVVGGGKFGIFYVMNTANLGHVQSGNGQIVQSLNNAGGYIKSGPVYWNRTSGAGPWMYDWSDGSAGGDVLKAYHFNGTTFDAGPVSQGAIIAPSGNSGGVLTVSANGGAPGTGIIWGSMPLSTDGDNGVQRGVLRAFNAENLSEIWNSTLVAADNVGNWPKFSPPLVANGRVYVGSLPSTSNTTDVTAVHAYAVAPAAPTLSVSAEGCNDLYDVTWSAVPNATSYQFWDYLAQSPDAYKTQGAPVRGTFVTIAPTRPFETYAIQACNGSSCGRLSNPITLTYYTGGGC